MSDLPARLDPPERILMGPGPSNCHPRVLQAMAAPIIGHLDPAFLRIMNEVQGMLRTVMQTTNPLTIPVSATGSAGMEACFVNLVEPGDRCVVGLNGVFGQRMADNVGRCGGEVIPVEAPWGEAIPPSKVRAAVAGGNVKLVAIVHAETSTGVRQPIEEISAITHEAGALLLVDTVTSLGGHPVKVDEWGVDACYSGTQKCLSVPPGLAPISFSPRAIEALERRKGKVQSWYLDLTMVRKYWGDERTYHHTAPVNMIYALHEGLRLILEEGLEARWARHQRHHDMLVAGLDAMGLSLLPTEEESLWSLNAVRVPEGVDEAGFRRHLLEHYSMEIGGGLGDLKGRVWRVGLMGHSSTERNVQLFLHALREYLG